MNVHNVIDRSKLKGKVAADMHRIVRDFVEHPLGPQSLSRPGTNTVVGAVGLQESATYGLPKNWEDGDSLSNEEKVLFKSCAQRLRGAETERYERAKRSKSPLLTSHYPKDLEPYAKKKLPLPLSAKEQDFIYRYSEYKNKQKLREAVKAHDHTCAYRAYTNAFVSFCGRPPSEQELQEADRLQFVVAKSGKIGVGGRRPISTHDPAPRSGYYYLKSSYEPHATNSGLGADPTSSLPRTRNSTSRKNCGACGARLPPKHVQDECPACELP